MSTCKETEGVKVEVGEYRDLHDLLVLLPTPHACSHCQSSSPHPLPIAAKGFPGKDGYVWAKPREMALHGGWGESRLKRAREGQGGGPGAFQ